MTDDKKIEPLPKDLISDAEFVALMEAELRDTDPNAPSDELAQKRLWQRLEASTGASSSQAGAATAKSGRRMWPWAAAAVLALGLLPLFQKKEEDHFKGALETSPAAHVQLSLVTDKDAYTISYTGAEEGFLALVEDKDPYDVLWLRNGQSGSWAIPKTEVQASRVCAITGQDISDITKKLNIIRELRQLPTDISCLTFPDPSE